MSRYWYARGRPNRRGRRPMMAITAEGRAMGLLFGLSLIVGVGLAVFLSVVLEQRSLAIWIGFSIMIAGSAAFFVSMVVKGDGDNLAEDYLSGKLQNSDANAATWRGRSAVTEYWFARYKPGLPGTASRGLVPLGRKGRTAIAAFVLGLVLGGLAMLVFGPRDQMQVGIPLFIVLALAGGSFFIWASVAKTDPVKSVADYRADGVLK